MQVNRNKIPYSETGIILKIPEIKQEKFENIKIYKYHDNSQLLVNFKINFKNGAEAAIKPGVANLTMNMLSSGTKYKNASQIAESFESLGAVYFFNAYWDECSVGFSCLGTYFNNCFDILKECLFEPLFDDSEINRQKERISALIMQNNADPSYTAQIAFNYGYFKNHKYGQTRYGSLSDVENITKEELLDFYSLLLKNSEISIIITGNFDDTEIDKAVNQNFAALKNNSSNIKIPYFIYSKSENVIAGKEESLQTNLRIGKPALGRKHIDYPAFQIINTIFGGFFLSRLNHVLREVKGLTYGIYSFIDSRKYADTLVISTSINSDKTNESIKDILDISFEISKSAFTKEEISRSVEYMTGSFARSLETPKQISGLIQTIDSFGLDKNYFLNFYQKIRQITPDELFEIQKKYFSDTDYFLAASGNINLISEAFKDFGNYNTIENLD